MIGIYKITNPKGKIYIGQSINIEDRWEKGHKYLVGSGLKLKNSLKKYGWENHILEILEECEIKELNKKETYYIKEYNSYVNGLNSTQKGGAEGYRNEVWRQNHSKGLKGRKGYWKGKKRLNHSKFLKENGCGFNYIRTEEHKQNLRDKLSGKKLSKDTREKISKNKIGKKTKKIQCIETNHIFNSIKECSEVMNISKGCICSYVKGNYPYPKLKGFSFKYYLD